jgi:hypothetical protein
MESITHTVVRMVREGVGQWKDNEVPPDTVNLLLRLLCRWRSQGIAAAYRKRVGTTIWGGLFQGMDYLEGATEGALAPRLLGTYEAELHPYIRYFARQGLDCVIDVGCAEGYYAVGLARLIPEITVYAHDTEEKARAACAQLAAMNGVSDRVIIGGEFKPEDFEAFAGRRVLVLVDTEGAEVDILQPELSPALAGMNIIVETHDLYRANARATIQERFAPTHDIDLVLQQLKTIELPPWMKTLPHLDQLLATWEWRAQPTPWLVMRPKAQTPAA